MSRTYRKKKGYLPRWITEDHTRVQYGDNRWDYTYVWTPLKGDALKKSLAIWHSDSCYRMRNPSKWFRRIEEKSFRTRNRTELCKYRKNYEYEVMILSKGKLPYWD